jgi:hypothetical protein
MPLKKYCLQTSNKVTWGQWRYIAKITRI